MKISLYLLSTLLLLNSCSEKPEEKKTASTNETIPKVEKHVVDLNEEGFSIDELLKIDKEIPVIEVIVPKDWNQEQISNLGKLEMLKDVVFTNTNLKDIKLSFLGKKRTIKTISFENCQISAETLQELSRTVLEKISFIETDIDDKVIEALKKAPRLKEIESSTPDKLKAALPKVKISKI
ncbi:MAG: hypothetical protein NE334_20910 [Lentisphaeraceae bacterium]|nr:hypothetical protein [Lentisphaeraceae bacterium]